MQEELEIGARAPDFSLLGADGLIYTLGQFRGSKAIAIWFVSDESSYELDSIEYMEELARHYHNRGVTFIAIDIDSSKGESLREHSSIIYLYDRTADVARRYGIKCTPECFLFSGHRTLVYSGALCMAQEEPLKNAIEELLDSRPISISKTDAQEGRLLEAVH